MQINSQSTFATVPAADIQRSSWVRPSGLKTTFDSSYLVPIFWDEVLPGDTWQMDMSFVARMQTPIFPVMDEANIEVYWFYVPNRLVWDHWKEFMGENNTSYWTPDIEYSVPQLHITSTMDQVFDKNDLATYMGIPLHASQMQPGFEYDTEVNHLPIRAYCKIWNDWFRDQNVMDPAYLNTGDADVQGRHGYETSQYDTRSAYYGGGLLKVSKYHDLFTSALPSPQKGEAVTFDFVGQAPVLTSDSYNSRVLEDANPMKWFLFGTTSGFSTSTTTPIGVTFAGGQEEQSLYTGTGNAQALETLDENSFTYAPANLYVDGSTFGSWSINDLRFAFQMQRLLERDARGGTRYIELLKSHFGVTSPDARLQRSEYLGGIRVPVNMDQVLQTSATNDVSPQGNTSAFSLTSDRDHCFTSSFTEHGIILGLACVRQVHTYQNGISRLWKRKDRFDYYWPALAHIGEQPIRNEEIFAWSSPESATPPTDTFGYQEAWYEYRYKPSMVTGEMASNAEGSLDVWHYADQYYTTPILSQDFINETDVNIERTIAVQGGYHQFLFDAQFMPKLTRAMPLYSVPGLIDHF